MAYANPCNDSSLWGFFMNKKLFYQACIEPQHNEGETIIFCVFYDHDHRLWESSVR